MIAKVTLWSRLSTRNDHSVTFAGVQALIQFPWNP